jgi:hypothetical protein
LKVSAIPGKKQMVATEQERVQANKEDATQLYIILNIIEKGFVRSFIHLFIRSLFQGNIGWLGGIESSWSKSPGFGF